MNKNQLISILAFLPVVACAQNLPTLDEDDLPPMVVDWTMDTNCPNGPANGVVVVKIQLDANLEWMVDVDKKVVCVKPGGKVRFTVQASLGNRSVATVPKEYLDIWMFGVRPGNGNTFEITAPSTADDYKYSVFATGKVPLDPIVAVREDGAPRLNFPQIPGYEIKLVPKLDSRPPR